MDNPTAVEFHFPCHGLVRIIPGRPPDNIILEAFDFSFGVLGFELVSVDVQFVPTRHIKSVLINLFTTLKLRL